MPFGCAKAMAMTFCYPIRYLLTPVFGRDFLDMCYPETHPEYGSFKVDPAIIQVCTDEMESWRLQKSHDTPMSSVPASPSVSSLKDYRLSASASPMFSQSLGPRAAKERLTKTMDLDNGSDCDFDLASSSEGTSPQVSPKTVIAGPKWTSINRARRTRNQRIISQVDPAPDAHSPARFNRTADVGLAEAMFTEAEGAIIKLQTRTSSKAPYNEGSKRLAPRISIGLDSRDYDAAKALLELREGRKRPRSSSNHVRDTHNLQTMTAPPRFNQEDTWHQTGGLALDRMDGIVSERAERSTTADHCDNPDGKRHCRRISF